MRAFGRACCRRRPARPCCDGGLVAALALAAGGVLHGVGLVEDDDAVEIGAQPFDDLLDPRSLLVALVGAQRGVGGEQDAFRQTDRRALAEARQRRDQQPLHAERRPVALRVLDQLVGLGDPDRAAAALQPVVEQDAGDLPALAAPVPSPRNQPRRKRTASSASSARGADDIEGLVDGPGAGEMPACASPA